MNKPFLTVFTPAYNRAYTLPRTYESMKQQKNKSILKEALFVEWVFFCVYWGAFAILWHFGTLIETRVPGVSYLHEAYGITHTVAVIFYALGSVLMLGNARKSISSQSPKPSDTPDQTQV